jgi:poly(ribitol-phosphate) beta-N-acetylglucosaminyltransferase
MTRVSVIVPVYNPGSDIDDCIRSLLNQTLPRSEYEAIFVDDGSTDGTGARLDALAAEHPHVRVEHIPNSGWPGRPRNVGLDMARGDYVYFVDNDDWIEADALERMHKMAVEDDADVLIGKVVGHGHPVPRAMFARNLHGVRFDSLKLVRLLTPHKLFRRAFVEQHGLRFPEGKRRLEDHPFVLSAYLAGARISVLADRPCYHWVKREESTTASTGGFEAKPYYDNVREVLDLIEAGTEAGPWQDELLTNWYLGKMLKRVGGRSFLWRDEQWRQELFEAVRELALERYGEDVHDRLPFALRMRSRVLRAGDLDTLGRLSRYERRMQPIVRIRGIEHGSTHLVLRLESWLGTPDARLRFERRGDRTLWIPPTQRLDEAVPEDWRDATGELRRSTAEVFLHNVRDESEYTLPARTRVRLKPDDAGRIRPRLHSTVPIAPTAAAAGGPLPPGQWEVRVAITIAGFSRITPVMRRGEPLVVTTFAPGRIVVGSQAPPPPSLPSRVYRRLPGPLTQTVRRTRARAAAAARR